MGEYFVLRMARCNGHIGIVFRWLTQEQAIERANDMNTTASVAGRYFVEKEENLKLYGLWS